MLAFVQFCERLSLGPRANLMLSMSVPACHNVAGYHDGACEVQCDGLRDSKT